MLYGLYTLILGCLIVFLICSIVLGMFKSSYWYIGTGILIILIVWWIWSSHVSSQTNNSSISSPSSEYYTNPLLVRRR